MVAGALSEAREHEAEALADCSDAEVAALKGMLRTLITRLEQA